jgi:hypothetical protein
MFWHLDQRNRDGEAIAELHGSNEWAFNNLFWNIDNQFSDHHGECFR